MSDFASFWTRFHPAAPPVAHLLRQAEPEKWVRFHSLPFSKRYATSTREKWIILDRANQLANRVLGDNSHCWMVQAEPDYGEAANDADVFGTISGHGLNFEFECHSSEDDCAYRIFSKPVIWSAGAFNDLIAMIAEDELLSTMWVSMESGATFAPYDGGSDLLLPSTVEIAKLKSEFSAWLSDHPDGL